MCDLNQLQWCNPYPQDAWKQVSIKGAKYTCSIISIQEQCFIFINHMKAINSILSSHKAALVSDPRNKSHLSKSIDKLNIQKWNTILNS